MAHPEARAWWADVEHLRDVYERTDEARRRADRADVEARHAARERPHAEIDAGRATAPPRRGGHANATAIPARRTVEIRGRTVPAPALPPRTVELDRRRPPRRPVERVGARPDRVAMWALLMGIVLILVAVGTADASVLAS